MKLTTKILLTGGVFILAYFIAIPFGIFIAYATDFDLETGYHKSTNGCFDSSENIKCIRICYTESYRYIFVNCAGTGLISIILIMLFIGIIGYLIKLCKELYESTNFFNKCKN